MKMSGRPGPAGEIGRVSAAYIHRAEVCGESWRGVVTLFRYRMV